MPKSAAPIRRTETNLDRFDPSRAEVIRRDPPRILTLNEAGALIRVSPRTMRNLVRRGDCHSLRIGGGLRFDSARLLREVAELSTK